MDLSRKVQQLEEQLRSKQDVVNDLMKKLSEPNADEGEILDLPTEEGIGDQYGLVEIRGGIGIDSCASDNVMAKKMSGEALCGIEERSTMGQRQWAWH